MTSARYGGSIDAVSTNTNPWITKEQATEQCKQLMGEFAEHAADVHVTFGNYAKHKSVTVLFTEPNAGSCYLGHVVLEFAKAYADRNPVEYKAKLWRRVQ